MHSVDNYYTDQRVVAGESSPWYKEIDEKKMVALIEIDEVEEWIPFEYVVCPLCDGKGKHVNPSIDCNGISGEQFREDPDFAEEYFSGVYDIPCNLCKGERVVPSTTDKRVVEWQREEAEFQAMCAAERRMGA